MTNRLTLPGQSKGMSDLRKDKIETPPAGSCCLSFFSALDAPIVASWIRSDRELTWLAPGTPPPLTPAKVMGWGKKQSERILFWTESSSDPIGYAELNHIPGKTRRCWIGHFILNPVERGKGYGERFAGALLDRAFHAIAARDVLLVVFPDNVAAIRCYEKNGMVITGRETKFFRQSRQRHVFLRMEIHWRRYNQLRADGRLHQEFCPLIEDSAWLRQGMAAHRRRFLTQREARHCAEAIRQSAPPLNGCAHLANPQPN